MLAPIFFFFFHAREKVGSRSNALGRKDAEIQREVLFTLCTYTSLLLVEAGQLGLVPTQPHSREIRRYLIVSA